MNKIQIQSLLEKLPDQQVMGLSQGASPNVNPQDAVMEMNRRAQLRKSQEMKSSGIAGLASGGQVKRYAEGGAVGSSLTPEQRKMLLQANFSPDAVERLSAKAKREILNNLPQIVANAQASNTPVPTYYSVNGKPTDPPSARSSRVLPPQNEMSAEARDYYASKAKPTPAPAASAVAQAADSAPTKVAPKSSMLGALGRAATVGGVAIPVAQGIIGALPEMGSEAKRALADGPPGLSSLISYFQKDSSATPAPTPAPPAIKPVPTPKPEGIMVAPPVKPPAPPPPAAAQPAPAQPSEPNVEDMLAQADKKAETFASEVANLLSQRQGILQAGLPERPDMQGEKMQAFYRSLAVFGAELATTGIFARAGAAGVDALSKGLAESKERQNKFLEASSKVALDAVDSKLKAMNVSMEMRRTFREEASKTLELQLKKRAEARSERRAEKDDLKTDIDTEKAREELKIQKQYGAPLAQAKIDAAKASAAQGGRGALTQYQAINLAAKDYEALQNEAMMSKKPVPPREQYIKQRAAQYLNPSAAPSESSFMGIGADALDAELRARGALK